MVRKRKSQLSVFTYRPLIQNKSQLRIDLQAKKTYKMSNYKPNPNIPEDRIITVWGCSDVFTLRAMDDQERKFAMHARLKSILPQNTNFYIQEIREVFVSARDRDDYRTQKAFVELTTKERANEIMSRYWNPNNNASRSQIGISIRHYVKHNDEEEYLNGAHMRSNKRPRSESSPVNTDVQRKQTGERDSQVHESIHQNRRLVSSSSGSSSLGATKRTKSKHERWQENTISANINTKLNHQKTIEEHIRRNIFEMVVFALKYKKDDSHLALRNWMIDNLQMSGKRIIILIHNNKNSGFEWNPYDLIIYPLWQRKWEYVLGLENDDMREDFRDTDSAMEVIKTIYNIIRDADDKQIKPNASITEQAFYITETLTPMIAPILYGHYICIMDNPKLNIENISKKDLNEVCLEINTQAIIRSWEREEMTQDIENIRSINIPGLYGITLDKNLCKITKMWIIRGVELAKITSLKITDDNNDHLSQGIVRNIIKPFLDATGEVIYPEKVEDDNLTIFKAAYSLGYMALHRKIERNVYIFNKNGSDHPEGPDYDIHPRNLYFDEINRYIQIFIDDPYEIIRRREAGLNDPEEEENASDNEDEAAPTENTSENGASGLNISVFQSDNYNYKMSTDDRLDDSRSESDTENTVEITQPLRKFRKSKSARLATDNKEVEATESIAVIGCHKNKVNEKYLVPSSRHFICEYCQDNFKDQPALGRHWQNCEAWKRTLKGYEALEKEESDNKNTHKKAEPKTKGDMTKIQILCKLVEEQSLEDAKCQGKRCPAETKRINQLETTLKIIKEFKELLAEKNEALHHKNLVIRQHQIQKTKDDREVILHRKRLIEGLEKTLKIERILSEHDIRFIRKDTNKCASKREIKALIKKGHSTCDVWRTCSNCERTLKEEEPFELHTELLYCNHDQSTNLTIKKYLTGEKFIKQYNAGMRLTRILDNLDETIMKHYSKK